MKTKKEIEKEFVEWINKNPEGKISDFIYLIISKQTQEIMDEIEKLPTGMFDSTPYKEDLLKKLTP